MCGFGRQKDGVLWVVVFGMLGVLGVLAGMCWVPVDGKTRVPPPSRIVSAEAMACVFKRFGRISRRALAPVVDLTGANAQRLM